MSSLRHILFRVLELTVIIRYSADFYDHAADYQLGKAASPSIGPEVAPPESTIVVRDSNVLSENID